MAINIPRGSWAVVFTKEANKHPKPRRPDPAAGTRRAEPFTERVAVGSL